MGNGGMMENSFWVYLLYLAFAIVLFAGIFTLIIIKIRNRGKGKVSRKSIRCGNISMLFDKSGNVVIIPDVKDKFGAGRALDTPAFLDVPYNAAKLGQAVLCSMKLCESGTPGSDGELMSRLGFIGWKEFSEGRRNISVHYHDGYGIVFNTTKRKDDGAYQFNHPGFEKVMSADATDKELGEMILTLLPRCKA